MAFTTWAAYKTTVLDSIVAGVASGSIMLQSVAPMGPDGVSRTFRNLLELERHVDWVQGKVVQENAATDGRGRRLFMVNVQ
jgi:hypothetical protein